MRATMHIIFLLIETILLAFSKASSAIILGATTTLLIT